MFDFQHIKLFDRNYIVFATPGILHAGLSLQIFKQWAPNEKNMVIMPGYCVAGMVGSKVLFGHENLCGKQTNDRYHNFQFSVCHSDSKGIMQLIRQCEPKNVVLVHGEATKMEFLKQKITQEFGVGCFMPANGESVTVVTKPTISVDMPLSLLKRTMNQKGDLEDLKSEKRAKRFHGVLVISEDKLKVEEPSKILNELDLKEHEIRFTSTVTVPRVTMETLHSKLEKLLPDHSVLLSPDGSILIGSVLLKCSAEDEDEEDLKMLVSWSYQEEVLGSTLFHTLKHDFENLIQL